MNRLLFSCEGLTINTLRIPAFQLNAGDFVCLHMPCLAWSADEEQVVQVFTGKRVVPGVHLHGRVDWAYPAIQRRGLLSLFHRPRPVDWLRQSAGVARADAAAIVTRVALRTDDRVGRLRLIELPGTPKALLGLEAAWARGANVVVFTTVGLDPLGVQAMFETAASHLPPGAAIYLSYEYITNGRMERNHFAAGVCMEVGKESLSTASLTPAED
jgi:hypothetical protein